MNKTNQQPYKSATDLLDRARRILITTHIRPDGDALGSLFALAESLRSRGKKIDTLLLSPVPPRYTFLFDTPPKVLDSDTTAENLTSENFDLITIVDTNSRSQLPGLDPLLAADTPILVIDHHLTSDNLGTVEIADTSAAAAGMLVYQLLETATIPLTPETAEALFVAVATDTGWFRFPSADSRVYHAAAALVEAGADPARIYDRLYQQDSPQRFALLTAMLDSLELSRNDTHATMTLTRADFERTGAQYTDTEDFINECQRIATVETAALLVEQPDGRIKCSLRSSGRIDVSQIARKFGGGGHKAAAGTYLPPPIENAKKIIQSQLPPEP